MTLKLLLIAVAIWAIGVLSAFVGIEITGGWYEYHVFTQQETIGGAFRVRINSDGWELVPGIASDLNLYYLRRPRIRGLLHRDTGPTIVPTAIPLPTNTAAAPAAAL